MKCKMCGRNISPLMRQSGGLCESCYKIKKLEAEGTLAKNGLAPLDLI